MKTLLFSLLTAVLFSSCSTMMPLDPMTATPCPKCLPGNFNQQNQKCYTCGTVEGTK
ncbi:MAG: hypothetical protein QM680_09175 [Luteolibacter sp.]